MASGQLTVLSGGVCNRYTLIDPDSAFAEIARILGIPLDKPQWVTKRYNLGLMQAAPTIVNRGGGVEVLPMQFGRDLKVKDGVRVVGNARVETIFERPTFKRQTTSHRCLIPTTGFIDWETDESENKWPHLFTPSHGRPFAMAAIWNVGKAEDHIPPHFYIVTTEPNAVVKRFHDRMPVMLPENRVARWLDPTPMAEAEFRAIAKPYADADTHEREINDYANNVKHEGPQCLAPPRVRPNQLDMGF